MNRLLTATLVPTLLSMVLTSTSALAKDYSLQLSAPDKVAKVEVDLNNGSISVVGYDGKTIEISSSVEALESVPNGDDFEFDLGDMADKAEKPEKGGPNKKRSTEGLKKISNTAAPLMIEERNNRVEISSQVRKRAVNLTIKVPRDSILDLSVQKGGDIRVSNVSGAIELSSHKGAIIAEGISGPIVAETHRKDIEVSFSSLNQSQPSSLTSHIGSVDISLSPAFKAKIAVQTYKGEIYSGLTQAFTVDDSVNEEKNTRRASRKITLGGLMTAQVNGGTQLLTINTYSGDIYIRKP